MVLLGSYIGVLDPRGGEEKKYIHPELSRENEKKHKKIAAIN